MLAHDDGAATRWRNVDPGRWLGLLDEPMGHQPGEHFAIHPESQYGILSWLALGRIRTRDPLLRRSGQYVRHSA